MQAADPGFRAPPLGLVPLTLDPATAVTAVVGPQPEVAGLVRYFLAQLAGYPAARRTHVLVHGSPADLPLAARFLPRVTLSCQVSATAARLRAGPGPGCDRGVLIVLHRAETHPGGALPDPFRTAGAADLADLAASKGWQVFECGPRQDRSDSAAIILGGRTARLSSGGNAVRFLPDLVPYPVFDNFCRRLGAAGATTAAPQGVLDRAVPLAGILPCEARDVGRRWARSADAAGLSVPVGIGRQGTVHLDIERDGPHLLVAGTTGSGKSEFLRTLVAALAASYPPDLVNLLLVDFKGGSGLGPLTGLRHCVGMLSDLGLQEVDRTLVSLRAEVRRREEVLASAGASDLTAYRTLDRGLPVLPHLAIVIDEFRMLVDEAPRALTELMRIAAIGRSLGIHLIMATQRPQGSITADIRANVTSRIVLRVQSGMESIDVMNSTLAADIPIAAPGRAFLVKGSEAPQEFQTARLTPDASPADLPVTVLTALEWLCRGPAEEPGQTDHAAAGAPVAALTEVTGKLWSAGGGTPPHRPVAAALPAALPFPSSDSPGRPAPAGAARSASGPSRPLTGPAGAVRLGWLDLPEQQRLAELCWHPEDHGHLGLVGGAAGGAAGRGAGGGAAADGAAGGANEALALIVDQLLAAEHEFHLYILDAAGSMSGTVASPRVGAMVRPHELRRAVRVLERLAAEMTRRLSTPHLPAPRLVLALCGWGSWLSAFRSGPLVRGEDLVQDIVRDGARAGIAVLVSGERELTTSRFFGGIANRIFFPAGCSDEDRIAWPRLPAVQAIPGRAAALGPFAGPAAGAVPHIAQLYAAPPATPPACLLPAGGKAAFRVEALPQRVRVSEVLARIGEPVRMPRHRPDSPAKSPALTTPLAAAPRPAVRLCLGVGGDELEPAFLTLPAGGVLAALGGPGSGKTTLLTALAALNCPAGGWLRPAAGTDPAEYWAGLHARARGGGLSREAVLLADDLDLQSEDTSRHLLGINGLGWTVVLTAGFSPALQQRVPLVQCARRNGTGILLCPRSLLDGELFGVRLELDVSPPPGRGVLISGGLAVAVQLADPAAAGPLRPARPDAA
jgi:S-DNA-T family DNA segregation ATPase FtsK/SpoIIIE